MLKQTLDSSCPRSFCVSCWFCSKGCWSTNWTRLRTSVAAFVLGDKGTRVSRRSAALSIRIWTSLPRVLFPALQSGLLCCKFPHHSTALWERIISPFLIFQTRPAGRMALALSLCSSLALTNLLEKVKKLYKYMFLLKLIFVSFHFSYLTNSLCFPPFITVISRNMIPSTLSTIYSSDIMASLASNVVVS